MGRQQDTLKVTLKGFECGLRNVRETNASKDQVSGISKLENGVSIIEWGRIWKVMDLGEINGSDYCWSWPPELTCSQRE